MVPMTDPKTVTRVALMSARMVAFARPSAGDWAVDLSLHLAVDGQVLGCGDCPLHAHRTPSSQRDPSDHRADRPSNVFLFFFIPHGALPPHIFSIDASEILDPARLSRSMGEPPKDRRADRDMPSSYRDVDTMRTRQSLLAHDMDCYALCWRAVGVAGCQQKTARCRPEQDVPNRSRTSQRDLHRSRPASSCGAGSQRRPDRLHRGPRGSLPLVRCR